MAVIDELVHFIMKLKMYLIEKINTVFSIVVCSVDSCVYVFDIVINKYHFHYISLNYNHIFVLFLVNNC